MPKRQPQRRVSNSASRSDAKETGLLTTGKLAEATNTTLRTVRFYEQEGLILPSKRTLGKHRRFEPVELARLRAILRLRQAGISLEDIRSLASVRTQHHAIADASRELGRAMDVQIERLQARLTVLSSVKTELEGTRRRLLSCSRCADDARFLGGCNGCDTLARAGQYSELVRLLWSTVS